MGVQCTLLGHAFDATEFEEERRERPDGSVLVCREYQVCRRCGTRQELYRNEQLLPNEADAAGASGENDVFPHRPGRRWSHGWEVTGLPLCN